MNKLVVFSEETEAQLSNVPGYGARTRSQMSRTQVCAANYCQEATPPHALIHYYILLAKIEKCLFSLGVHLHIPVFTLLLSTGYWCYYSVWLKLFKNGDVWENITGMRNPGTSNLCRVYDSMFGLRSTLQPCRKALQILDFLGYWCISERCSALFVEFGDSFQ